MEPLQRLLRRAAGGRSDLHQGGRRPRQRRQWARARGRRWLALDDDGSVIGIVAVLPCRAGLTTSASFAWSCTPSIVAQGIGRALARHALFQAVEMGLAKVIVEVVAQQESAAAMFTALGFEGEALLRDQIRDRSGQPRDLIMLAHYVQDTWSAMSSVGLDHELGSTADTDSERR